MHISFIVYHLQIHMASLILWAVIDCQGQNKYEKIQDFDIDVAN